MSTEKSWRSSHAEMSAIESTTYSVGLLSTKMVPKKAAFEIDYEALEECNDTVLLKPYPDDGQLYCNATFDGWLCFDYTLAGETAYKPCPVHMQPGFNPDEFAAKQCLEDGRWFSHPYTGNIWTNYSQCPNLQDERSVIMVYISGYSISLILLTISIVIFNLFRQLKCNRVTLHQHLFVSYILTGSLWIVTYTQVPMRSEEGVPEDNPVWCRVLHVFTQYMTVCNYCWMLCEGFYLHTLIVVAFTKEKLLLWLCYLIGWGFPLLPTLIYACLRWTNASDNVNCWLHESSLLWTVIGPVVLSLLVNLIFLFNIFRILLSKLRAFNTNENHQNRRAVRAVLILIPLLGLQYLVIPFRPSHGPKAMYVFKMVSAFLVSFQGVMVALIFCFFNGEVMAVIRRKWNQLRHVYDPRHSERRRSLTNTTAVWDDSSTTAKNGGVRLNSRIFTKYPQENASEMQAMVKHTTDEE